MTPTGAPPKAARCLALDIGASKIDGAVVYGDGTIVARRRLDVLAAGDDLFVELVALCHELDDAYDVAVVGVGCAGPMTRGGAEVSPLNIAAWQSFPLRATLREALAKVVTIDGDAKALALAEGRFGAAQRVDSYLSMVVSTGVGGGLVLNGRLLDGASGNAGHVGHVNVVANGALCACGSYGCLEAEVSGRSIEARTGRPPAEADQATRLRTGELVGRAVGSLASVLDFQHCFVAGSVALGFGDDFFSAANKSARAHAQLSFVHELEIRPSALGSDGPLLGAALVGWRGAA